MQSGSHWIVWILSEMKFSVMKMFCVPTSTEFTIFPLEECKYDFKVFIFLENFFLPPIFLQYLILNLQILP